MSVERGLPTQFPLSKPWYIIYMLVLIAFFACQPEKKVSSPEYIAGISHWQQLRVDSLKGKTGYLNLAGLFWLSDGPQTIGSDSANTFIFPSKTASRLGTIVKANDRVWLIDKHPDVHVSGNLQGDSILVFDPDTTRVHMRFEDLDWFIIARGDDLGIRLRDYSHPLLESFGGIENFPIDINWRVEAKFETYPDPKIVQIKNQVGMTLNQEVYGQFHFELMGEQYTLEPISPLENETYFTMIYDQTSGAETYGSGRYIDVPRPDEHGRTYIDFNKAYNPPCAWTEFATCTFPHAANRLPLRIEAGEKYKSNH